MDQQIFEGIDKHLVIWAIVIVLGSVFWTDGAVVFSTAVGAGVSILNWFGYRWLGRRFLASKSKKIIIVLFFVKTTLVVIGVVVLLKSGFIRPMPLLFGFSSLVAAIVTRSLVSALRDEKTALKED